MCHKKNGGIDGHKSITCAWKLVLASPRFQTLLIVDGAVVGDGWFYLSTSTSTIHMAYGLWLVANGN